jgi:protein-S-isoprenylcysteine O-methyltransferase Ste14
MGTGQLTQGQLLRMAGIRVLGFLVALSLLLFLPAGTIRYWEGWVYILVLFVPVLVVMVYLIRTDHALIERRMHTTERQAPQRGVALLAVAWFLLVFVVPGFDHRFGWSDVPVALVIVADILTVLGYSLIVWVLRENSYASRVVEVEQEQKVICSGPYAIVRHPMYLGFMIMYLLVGLALGSYWALIPAPLIILILVARIRNEEAVLLRELKGYADYVKKVRYRLIPAVW